MVIGRGMRKNFVVVKKYNYDFSNCPLKYFSKIFFLKIHTNSFTIEGYFQLP